MVHPGIDVHARLTPGKDVLVLNADRELRETDIQVMVVHEW